MAYEQSVDSVGWAALDKFTFTVSSPPASLEAQTFDIDISYENVGPERNSLLLKNTGMITLSDFTPTEREINIQVLHYAR